MNEYFIGERVRFRPGAEVSPAVLKCEATVKGYEVDVLVGTIREDFLIVSVHLPNGRCEQWVNPREVEPVTKRAPDGRTRAFEGSPDHDSDDTADLPDGTRRVQPRFLEEEIDA